MSVDDASFAAWVEAGMPDKVVLVEQDYLYAVFTGPDVGYVATPGTLYFATRPFITVAGDTPSSKPYVDVVDEVPTFSRQIDQVTLGGRTSMSYGQLTLKNPEGLLDFMRTLALDGSETRCYLGAQTWARSDFRHVISARATGVSAPDTSTIVVGLADTAVLVNSAIATSYIGGTGPNAERTKAVIRGYCHNVEAVLQDITDLVYIFGDAGSLSPPTAVRDNGVGIVDGLSVPSSGPVVIDAGADTITYVGHGFVDEDIVEYDSGGLTNGLVHLTRYFVRNSTPDVFQLSATRTGAVVDITSGATTSAPLFTRYNVIDHADGTITLGHPPFGAVTCDVQGPEASDDDRRAGAIIDALVDDYTPLDSLSLVTGPHASYPTGLSTDFHLGLVVAEKQNILDVLDAIAPSGLLFYGFSRTGKFTYGRIGTAVALTSVMTLTDDDVVSFQGISTWNAPPLYSRWNWFYDKNWTPQNGDSLAPSVAPEIAAKYTRKGVFGSAQNTATRPPFDGFGGSVITYDTDPDNWHRTLTMSPETQTLLSMELDASADAEATLWYQTIRGIFKPYGHFVQMDLRLRAYSLELGDAVTLALTRYSLSNQKAQVVGLDINLVTNTVRALFWYRQDADVTTQGGWHG